MSFVLVVTMTDLERFLASIAFSLASDRNLWLSVAQMSHWQTVGQQKLTRVLLPPAWRTSGVAVLFLEPHGTPNTMLWGWWLFILCKPVFMIVFLEDILMLVRTSSWVSGTLDPMEFFRSLMILSVGVLPSGFGLSEVLVGVSPCLGVPRFPRCWMPFPTWPAFALFGFHLVNPDSFVFTSWSLTACEAKCLRPSASAYMLELLAACNGMSELLAPEREREGGSEREREFVDVATDRCLTTGSYLLWLCQYVMVVHHSSSPLLKSFLL